MHTDVAETSNVAEANIALVELQLFKMTEYSVIVTMKLLGTTEKVPDHLGS